MRASRRKCRMSRGFHTVSSTSHQTGSMNLVMHSPIPNITMTSTVSLTPRALQVSGSTNFRESADRFTPRPLDVSGSTGSALVWAGWHRGVFKFPGSNGSAIIVAVEQPTLSFSHSTIPRPSEWFLVPSSSHNAPTGTCGDHAVGLYPSQTE